jgi:hypothetical protein
MVCARWRHRSVIKASRNLRGTGPDDAPSGIRAACRGRGVPESLKTGNRWRINRLVGGKIALAQRECARHVTRNQARTSGNVSPAQWEHRQCVIDDGSSRRRPQRALCCQQARRRGPYKIRCTRSRSIRYSCQCGGAWPHSNGDARPDHGFRTRQGNDARHRAATACGNAGGNCGRNCLRRVRSGEFYDGRSS